MMACFLLLPSLPLFFLLLFPERLGSLTESATSLADREENTSFFLAEPLRIIADKKEKVVERNYLRDIFLSTLDEWNSPDVPGWKNYIRWKCWYQS
jgi:hypothetical protein